MEFASELVLIHLLITNCFAIDVISFCDLESNMFYVVVKNVKRFDL